MCLVTKQLNELRESGNFKVAVFEKEVEVILRIYYINGDTLGHKNMTGTFNASNINTNCPFWCCCCPLEDLPHSFVNCTLYTLKLYNIACQTTNELSQYSKYTIDNEFIDVAISDHTHGIIGIVPSEMLYVVGNGITKYMFECVHDIIGPNRSKISFL